MSSCFIVTAKTVRSRSLAALGMTTKNENDAQPNLKRYDS
jgi:hypothetical protein